MAAIALSAFSLFFVGLPQFQAPGALAGAGARTGSVELPNSVRHGSAPLRQLHSAFMLDGASPTAFDLLFMRAIEQALPPAVLILPLWWHLGGFSRLIGDPSPTRPLW